MTKLYNNQLTPCDFTEVKPKGWLLKQLQIQMNGLTGILYDIWDSVGSYSGWLGGTRRKLGTGALLFGRTPSPFLLFRR